MARPLKSLVEKRFKKVTLYLTAREYSMACSRSDATNKDLSVWFRETALSKVPPQPPIAKTDVEMIGQVRRLGGSLNQLLKVVQSKKPFLSHSFNFQIIDEINVLIDKICHQLYDRKGH